MRIWDALRFLPLSDRDSFRIHLRSKPKQGKVRKGREGSPSPISLSDARSQDPVLRKLRERNGSKPRIGRDAMSREICDAIRRGSPTASDLYGSDERLGMVYSITWIIFNEKRRINRNERWDTNASVTYPLGCISFSTFGTNGSPLSIDSVLSSGRTRMRTEKVGHVPSISKPTRSTRAIDRRSRSRVCFERVSTIRWNARRRVSIA